MALFLSTRFWSFCKGGVRDFLQNPDPQFLRPSRIFEARPPVLGTRYSAPGTRYPVPGTRYPVPVPRDTLPGSLRFWAPCVPAPGKQSWGASSPFCRSPSALAFFYPHKPASHPRTREPASVAREEQVHVHRQAKPYPPRHLRRRQDFI